MQGAGRVTVEGRYMIVQVESHVAWEAHACRVTVGVDIREECSIFNRNQIKRCNGGTGG